VASLHIPPQWNDAVMLLLERLLSVAMIHYAQLTVWVSGEWSTTVKPLPLDVGRVSNVLRFTLVDRVQSVGYANTRVVSLARGASGSRRCMGAGGVRSIGVTLENYTFAQTKPGLSWVIDCGVNDTRNYVIERRIVVIILLLTPRMVFL